MVRLIDEICSDDAAVARVASASYRHQLGFEKYVLHVSAQGSSIRLHYWDAVPQTEDIHSHCASFESMVLLGMLKQDLFEKVAGSTHCLFRYRFDATRGESVASVAGRCSVRGVSRSIFRAGDHYTLESSALHRVFDVSPGTVTASHWEPRRADALVLKADLASAGPSCACAGMQPSVVRGRLSEIVARLNVS